MKINPIMSYNQQNQVSHKGYLELVNPMGKTMKINPRAISRFGKEIIPYYYKSSNADWTYMMHLVEVTQVFFKNSTYFWVNAKEADVVDAVKQAVGLPNGAGAKVGEPLLPFLFSINNYVYRKSYAGLNIKNIKETMEKCPNTVDVEAYYHLPNNIQISCNSDLEKKFLDEGTPGGNEISLLDELVNWGQEDK